MSLITKAYNILTNPSERAKYDEKQISTFQDMRQSFNRFDQPATSTGGRGNQVQTRSSFSKGDLNAFNKAFEDQRRKDPNDMGYETEMLPRMNLNDAKNGYSGYSVKEWNDISQLKGENFNSDRFNELFDQYSSDPNAQDGGGMIEKPSDDPMGFSLASSTPFSEVSVYDGKMIVGRDTNDFTGKGMGLMYTDYKRGYSDTIITRGADDSNLEDDGLSLEQKMYRRKAELSAPSLAEGMGEEERKQQWQQREYQLEQEKQRAIEREREQQRSVVFKYQDQFGGNFLPPTMSRDTGSAPQQQGGPMPHQRAQPSTQQPSNEDEDRRMGRSYNDFMMDRMHNIY
jgi:curved DNA-binding protein CbpA